QSSNSAIKSRSRCLVWMTRRPADARVTTVRHRPCDNDAVFKPKPYRPRSPDPYFRRLPNLIASLRPLIVIPRPLPEMKTRDASPANSMTTFTSVASAVMLLSTRSAIAELKSYPMSRKESVRRAADGVTLAIRLGIAAPFRQDQGLTNRWPHLSDPPDE